MILLKIKGMVIIMRYKVRQIEYSEFVIEGKDEEEIKEWLRSNTIKEIQTINKNIVKHNLLCYDYSIKNVANFVNLWRNL